MNFRKNRAREELEINLIPFIDVLLVVLIFLMVSTTYTKDTALRINLPTAQAPKPEAAPTEIRVSIDASGRYALDNEALGALSPAQLGERIKAKAGAPAQDPAKSPVVIINADAAAAHQWVINVLEATRLAGLSQVSFSAQTQAPK